MTTPLPKIFQMRATVGPGLIDVCHAADVLAYARAADRDAERYRWHRTHGGKSWTILETQRPATDELFDAATDAAIDAARRKI